MAAVLPENEFGEWQRYAARRMFPSRRLELMLAQIAQILDASRGVTGKALADYLFDPEQPEPEGEASVEDAHDFFGFNPIN